MTVLIAFYDQSKKRQTTVCRSSPEKSKKCVCGKNPSSEADLFVRFFCGFLETADASAQFGGGCPPRKSAAAAGATQFRSNFVQQRQPTGTPWSLAQRAPAFLRFPPHRPSLPRATARAAHAFF